MSDEDEDVPGGYDLLMPFVTVTSVGGPHDDNSYAAGYAMGLLDVFLQIGKVEDPAPVPDDCLPQADLLAMRYGYLMEVDPQEYAGWRYVKFVKAAEEDDG